MTSEFMERLSKAHAMLMDKDFMQKLTEVELRGNKMQPGLSSGYVREERKGEASAQNYPRMKFELDSRDLTIKNERYVGRPNPNDDWDYIPMKDKYMHKFLP